MIAESLIGGALGGIFRLIPEVLKAWDRKDERKHELNMQDKALEFQRINGAQRLDELRHEGQQALDTGGLNALVEAVKAQGQMTGNWFFDGLNTLVRPILTYHWCIGFVSIVKYAQYEMMKAQGMLTYEAITLLWGPPEAAIVSGMINFWFLDRVIRKNNGQ